MIDKEKPYAEIKEKITLRPVGDADENFLLSIYASTRAEELALVPWGPEQKEAFVRMQFAAQKEHYASAFAEASHEIICLTEAMLPVGRLYLNRGADVFHILDITLLPQYRNAGIGSYLLGQILAEAGKQKKPVTIYVESFSPSLRLFQRLGFQKDHEKGFHFLMKLSPDGRS